jgi:hypothetical protein
MAHVVSQFEKALHKSQTPTKMIAIRRNERNHRRVILDFLSELAECMVSISTFTLSAPDVCVVAR